MVFVESRDEKTEVLNYLKTLYDSGSWNNGIEYDIDMIKRVKVTSLEEIMQLKDINPAMVKIDNLPFSVINEIPEITVSAETLTLIAEKLAQAILLAEEAMLRFREENPDEVHREFDWGWTYVCTAEVNEITQALVSLGFTSYADGIYRKNIISHYRDSLTTQIVGAEVAADYLTEELGQDFFVMPHED